MPRVCRCWHKLAQAGTCPLASYTPTLLFPVPCVARVQTSYGKAPSRGLQGPSCLWSSLDFGFHSTPKAAFNADTLQWLAARAPAIKRLCYGRHHYEGLPGAPHFELTWLLSTLVSLEVVQLTVAPVVVLPLLSGCKLLRILYVELRENMREADVAVLMQPTLRKLSISVPDYDRMGYDQPPGQVRVTLPADLSGATRLSVVAFGGGRYLALHNAVALATLPALRVLSIAANVTDTGVADLDWFKADRFQGVSALQLSGVWQTLPPPYRVMPALAAVSALCLSTCSELHSLDRAGALLGQLRFLDLSRTKFAAVPVELGSATRLEMLAMRECLQLQLELEDVKLLLTLPKLTLVSLYKGRTVSKIVQCTWNSESQENLLRLDRGLRARQPPAELYMLEWVQQDNDFYAHKRKIFRSCGLQRGA